VPLVQEAVEDPRLAMFVMSRKGGQVHFNLTEISLWEFKVLVVRRNNSVPPKRAFPFDTCAADNYGCTYGLSCLNVRCQTFEPSTKASFFFTGNSKEECITVNFQQPTTVQRTNQVPTTGKLQSIHY
jgi:hypothetical protein